MVKSACLTDKHKLQLRQFKDSFCLYDPVNQVLNDLSTLFESAEIGGEQLSMLLSGDTGTGKSALIRYFSNLKNFNKLDSVPVLLSRVPSKLNVEETTRQLLNDLGVFGSSNKSRRKELSDAHLTNRLIDALKERKTRVIIINEFQELVEFKTACDRQAIGNRIKLISEEAEIPIVLVGMPWVNEIMDDSQWASRLATRSHVLEYFSLSKRPKEYKDFLRQLEQEIPIKSSIDLTCMDVSIRLFSASCGEIRQIKALLTEAIRLSMLNRSDLQEIALSNAFQNLYLSANDNPFNQKFEKVRIREVEHHSRYIRGDNRHHAAIEPKRLSDFMSIAQILSKKK